MFTAMVPRMATKNPGGRPRGGQESGSKLVRMNEDLAEMIAWIVKIEGGTAATFVDPLLRPSVTAKFATIKSDVEKIKKAEDAAARLLDAAAAPTPADPEYVPGRLLPC